MKKGIITALVALGLFLSTFITSSAMAGGFGVGIIGAGGNFTTNGYEKEGGGDVETTTAKEESIDAFYGSVFAEYKFGETHGLSLGVSYTPGKATLGAKTRTDTGSGSAGASNDDGTYSAKATVSNHAMFYIEPTFMPTDNFGVYLKGGLARVTVNSLEKIAFGEDSSTYNDETTNGLLYGAGFTGNFGGGAFYKVEVIRVIYDNVTMTSKTGNKNIISADLDQVSGRFAIGYRF